MKYQPDQNLNKQGAFKVVERQTPPVLTLLLVILILLIYNFYQSGHGPTWIIRNTFQLDQVINLLDTQKYAQIANLLFTTNFANSNIWQLILSIYFVCLFGIPVEKRLGPMRFISLIFLACTLPWIVQFLDLHYSRVWPIMFEHPKQNIYFFGQYCIMLALASTYSVFVQKKESGMSEPRLHRKDRTEIFNRSHTKAMNERFGLSPNLFFSAVIVYVFASHYIISYFYKDYDTIGLYAAVSALAIGYIIASFINIGLQDSFEEHPLKHAAIKHYNELLDLDVGHDNAVKGAAKTLGLPDYQVDNWVKKNKGKLRST